MRVIIGRVQSGDCETGTRPYCKVSVTTKAGLVRLRIERQELGGVEVGQGHESHSLDLGAREAIEVAYQLLEFALKGKDGESIGYSNDYHEYCRKLAVRQHQEKNS